MSIIRNRLHYLYYNNNLFRKVCGDIDKPIIWYGSSLYRCFLLGVDATTNDIDLVLNNNCNLDKIFTGYDQRPTSFGGKHLLNDTEMVDVYHLRDNWAFKQKKFPISFHNLSKTTFLTLESLCVKFCPKTLKIYGSSENRFYECIENRTLDINLKDNPDPKRMVGRVNKLIEEFNFNMSIELQEYLGVN